jgi:hypothetical protein
MTPLMTGSLGRPQSPFIGLRIKSVLVIQSKHPFPDEASIQYDIPTLRALALEGIRSGLDDCDIIEELFSAFASQYARHFARVGRLLIEKHRYAEIRDLYARQLAYVWEWDSTEATRTGVMKKVHSFFKGELDHAAEILSALSKIIVAEGGVVQAPECASMVNKFDFFFFLTKQGCLSHIIPVFVPQSLAVYGSRVNQICS